MELQIVIAVIAAITTIISVILGARLQKANELNIKLRDSLSEKKATFYQDILSFLDDLIDGKYDRDDDNYEELREFMQSKFKDAAYYGSPDVIKSLGDLMQHFYTNNDPSVHVIRGRKLFAELAVQIRKDLGHTSSIFRKETWLDVLRFSIKDISTFIPQHKIKDYGKKTGPVMIHDGRKIK